MVLLFRIILYLLFLLAGIMRRECGLCLWVHASSSKFPVINFTVSPKAFLEFLLVRYIFSLEDNYTHLIKIISENIEATTIAVANGLL